MKKRRIAILIAICCLVLAGCSYPGDLIRAARQSSGTDSAKNNIITLEKGETLKTNQLELTVNYAQLTDYWSGYYVEDETWRYLVVNVTIDNTWQNGSMLDLYADDFQVSWSDLGNTAISHEDVYSDDQLADYNNFIKIFKNTSRTGNLIYVVPQDTYDFKLIFNQYHLQMSAEDTTDWYDDYYGYDDYDDFDGYDDFGGYDGFGGFDDFYSGYSDVVESYETMNTSLFQLKVNSITALPELNQDDISGQYVAVNVTISNTDVIYPSLEFYDYDFSLSWSNFYGNGNYPQTEIYTEDQLPTTYTIFSGDSMTGDLVYLVPKNASGFAIEYYSSYEQYRTYLVKKEDLTL